MKQNDTPTSFLSFFCLFFCIFLYFVVFVVFFVLNKFSWTLHHHSDCANYPGNRFDSGNVQIEEALLGFPHTVGVPYPPPSLSKPFPALRCGLKCDYTMWRPRNFTEHHMKLLKVRKCKVQNFIPI